MRTDEWRNVKGYDGKYQVNFFGQIRRMYPSGKTRIMTPFIKPNAHGSKRHVVKLTDLCGRGREIFVHQIVAEAFIGPCPKGMVTYHKNGIVTDNQVNNLAHISKRELGRLTGAASRRKPVAKINQNGEVVEFYSSAREAGKANYMSYQTIMDRCNGKVKKGFAPDGYEYAWDDDEASMGKAIRRIEIANGYMPKAPKVVFEF